MDMVAEQEIRARAGNLALAWYSERHGDFAGGSGADYGAMIVAAHVAADESRHALHRWVDAGRRADLSWAEIGALIGISKQAAQQRFGGGGEADPAERAADLIVRTGASAFNEMAIMEQEGRERRELVGTGLLSLAFRQTGSRWEYRRVTALFADQARAKLERAGWAHVSSWYPFHYFKRRLADG
jgi:hypothetical protein